MSIHSRTPSIDASTFAVDPESINPVSSVSSSSSVSVEYTHPENFDPVEYLNGCFASAMDASCLDDSVALQTKISGSLHNKIQHVVQTVKKVEQQMKSHQERDVHTRKTLLPKISKEISSAEKKVNKLSLFFKRNYPIEFSKAQNKVLNRVTDDAQGLYD